MKKYFAIEGQTKEIKVETGYELGGMSYFTGETSERGYYVYVRPVERSTSASGLSSESFIMFDGYKQLVKPVKRQGKVAAQEAEEWAEYHAMSLAIRLADQKGWVLA